MIRAGSCYQLWCYYYDIPNWKNGSGMQHGTMDCQPSILCSVSRGMFGRMQIMTTKDIEEMLIARENLGIPWVRKVKYEET